MSTPHQLQDPAPRDRDRDRDRYLRIVVASGKGGTGKTTVAAAVALVLAEENARYGRGPVGYVDCDVEEPNGHLFLRPASERRVEVETLIPEINAARCTRCGACVSACRAGALLATADQVVIFPELCNGCGACVSACPEPAIGEVGRRVGTVLAGTVERGAGARLAFVQGQTRVGSTATPEVIRAAIAAAPAGHTLVLDAPPGTSCPAVTAMRAADVVLLVAEPTPFGLNDLRLTVEVVGQLAIPCAVVINRSGSGDRAVGEYCASAGIPVLLEIPDDRRIAEAYSRGEVIVDACPDLRSGLVRLAIEVRALAGRGQPRATTRRPPTTTHRSGGQAPGVLPVPRPCDERPCDEFGRPSSKSSGAGVPTGLRELAVVSGKGGTGKTSITASLLALARQAAAVDADADAANLHLVMDPKPRGRWLFRGGSVAVVDQTTCTGCGACADACRFDAISTDHTGQYGAVADALVCEGCGVCVDICPAGAVELVDTDDGEWFVSDTGYGPLTHARLVPGRKNSGKLVTLLRDESRAVTGLDHRDLTIVDGSPGIGCAVIASFTGAHAALIVTEPTLSGLHDLQRVAELARQLGVPAGVCVNKADLNPQLAARAGVEAAALGLPVLGAVRYDGAVTLAQLMGTSVVALGDGPAARDIRKLWQRITQFVEFQNTNRVPRSLEKT